MRSQSPLLYQLSYAPNAWSPRQASNLHARGHLVLSQARLPIPPRGVERPGRTAYRAAKVDGLGGRVRTCDLVLPKHLRCQLRYTETGMELVVGMVGIEPTFSASRTQRNTWLSHTPMLSGGCKWIRTIGLRLIKTMLYR